MVMIYPLLLWDINVWWYIHFCCAMLLLWDACVFVKQCETFIVICIWLLILNVQPQRFRKYAAKLLLISHGCRPTLLHTILLIFYGLFSFIFYVHLLSSIFVHFHLVSSIFIYNHLYSSTVIYIHLSINLSILHFSFFFSFFLFFFLSMYRSIYPCIYLSICLSMCLSIYLSV